MSQPPRRATPRRYLMCPPAHFEVTYSINPWMNPMKPVDVPLALTQWGDLCDRFRALGHTVHELDPRPGLPDMVYAANGATVIDGRVLGARFAFEQRAAEADAHLEWFRAHGYREVHEPEHVNEGEGDFAVTASYLLAGRGYRASPLSHGEAQEFFGRPVIGLDLVDPRFYHLDTALACSTRRPTTSCTTPTPSPPAAGRCCASCSPTPARVRGGRRRLGSERRQRRPARRARPGRGGSLRAAAGAWLRARRHGSQRAVEGGRQREVLHAGATGRLSRLFLHPVGQ